MAITLCTITTENHRVERLSFNFADEPFTEAGYQAALQAVHAAGSTASWRGVGADNGERIVHVEALFGSTWDQTEANIRAALAT